MWMIAIIIVIALGQCYIFFGKTLPGINKYKGIFKDTDNLKLKKREVHTGTRKVEKPKPVQNSEIYSYGDWINAVEDVETVEEEYEYEVDLKAPQIYGSLTGKLAVGLRPVLVNAPSA